MGDRLDLADVPGVEGVRVVVARWGNRLEGRPKSLLAGAEATGNPEERGKLDDAVDWLRELLKDGPVDSKEVRTAAKQSGIAQPTLERAKTKLRVRSRKRDYAAGWWWEAPEHGHPENGSNPQQPQNDGDLGKPTPLKPSCGAGSTEGDQAPEKNEGVDHLRSNLGVVRVPGV